MDQSSKVDPAFVGSHELWLQHTHSKIVCKMLGEERLRLLEKAENFARSSGNPESERNALNLLQKSKELKETYEWLTKDYKLRPIGGK